MLTMRSLCVAVEISPQPFEERSAREGASDAAAAPPIASNDGLYCSLLTN
jgi:hypothetical protein